MWEQQGLAGHGHGAPLYRLSPPPAQGAHAVPCPPDAVLCLVRPHAILHIKHCRIRNNKDTLHIKHYINMEAL